MPQLDYVPLEKLPVPRPVTRQRQVLDLCRDKAVLDLGCLDETAMVKQGSGEWLHGEIARVARSVLGVDNSASLPPEGLPTGSTSRIVRGDVMRLEEVTAGVPIDVIVAGELIEHLENPLAFFTQLRRLFPGRELVATTPNATSVTNVLLGASGRESSHVDHLQVFSYKTLNTLCARAGFSDWEIVPYHVYFTEMKLRAGGVRGKLVGAAERVVNACETVFPLLAGGLVLHVKRL